VIIYFSAFALLLKGIFTSLEKNSRKKHLAFLSGTKDEDIPQVKP
jgi:hypothetical protein